MRLLIIIGFFMVSTVHAKNSVNGTLSKINSFLNKKENYLQTSLGFGMGKFSRGKKFDDKYSANQTTVEGGLTVGLPIKNFSTTTLLGFSLINFNDKDLLKGQQKFTAGSEVDKHNAREFSIRQRLHYDLYIKKITVRPFLELGYGFGDYDYSVKNPSKNLDTEVDTGYTRLIVGMGAQAEYKNFLPFMKLELANMNYSDESEVSTKNGAKIQNTTPTTKSDLEEGNSFIISTGLGYKF
ncbi:MAG: hypothetical protein CME70_15965 [Halobacteriovorax sp.]|nr:hypothetical protein [Halobacteriovorax sp.]